MEIKRTQLCFYNCSVDRILHYLCCRFFVTIYLSQIVTLDYVSNIA